MKGHQRLCCSRSFYDGYICAVANIIKTHGETTIAKDVLMGVGKIYPDDTNPEDLKTLREAGLIK